VEAARRLSADAAARAADSRVADRRRPAVSRRGDGCHRRSRRRDYAPHSLSSARASSCAAACSTS
jgi:hypothetical protein